MDYLKRDSECAGDFNPDKHSIIPASILSSGSSALDCAISQTLLCGFLGVVYYSPLQKTITNQNNNYIGAFGCTRNPIRSLWTRILDPVSRALLQLC